MTSTAAVMTNSGGFGKPLANYWGVASVATGIASGLRTIRPAVQTKMTLPGRIYRQSRVEGAIPSRYLRALICVLG